MDDNAAILTKLQEGQAKVAQEIQTVQGGAPSSTASLAAELIPKLCGVIAFAYTASRCISMASAL